VVCYEQTKYCKAYFFFVGGGGGAVGVYGCRKTKIQKTNAPDRK
jgi:hypothetical protein